MFTLERKNRIAFLEEMIGLLVAKYEEYLDRCAINSNFETAFECINNLEILENKMNYYIVELKLLSGIEEKEDKNVKKILKILNKKYD
jgi:hypothetical protein